MVGGTLKERAGKVMMQAYPEGFGPGGLRVETLPQDGTLILFAQCPGEEDPLSLLRENASPGKTLPSYLVIDPDTGRPARRYAIPYRIWARPETLRAALSGGDPQVSLSCSSALRLWKQVPEGVAVHRYGRGARFTLFLDREPPLLTAGVFPAGVREWGDSSLPRSCLERMALILLARAGCAVRPYPFHILRERDFFGVERAVHIDKTNGTETLKTLENELIRGAEEDRKIMNALLSSRVSWETLAQVQAKERRPGDV